MITEKNGHCLDLDLDLRAAANLTGHGASLELNVYAYMWATILGRAVAVDFMSTASGQNVPVVRILQWAHYSAL